MQSKDNQAADLHLDKPLSTAEIPKDSTMCLVEYASFMGGGAKGAGVAGVLDELENSGILPQLTEVAGSSVGSIVATLLAVGYTPKQIKNLLLVTVDMILLQDKVEAGWLESTFLSKMTKTLTEKLEQLGDSVKDVEVLKPLLTLPKEACKVASTIIEKGEKIGQIGELVLGEHLGLWKGEVLSHLMKNLIKQKTGVEELTFQELAHLAEPAGGQFKKLHITGTNITDGVLEYFNSENTPDMPIHLAVRISASYPGAFIPVILQDKQWDQVREKMYVDGGYLENLPMVFHRPPYHSSSATKESPDFNRSAIAIVFQSESDEKAKKEIKGKKEAAAAFLATPLNQRQNFHKFAATIRIDPLNVTAMDFDLSEAQKNQLIESGAKGTRLEIRRKTKPLNFEELSVKELARLKGQFSFHLSQLEASDPNKQLKTVTEQFNEITRALESKMKKEGANIEEIEQIIRKERNKFKRIHELKLAQKVEPEGTKDLEQGLQRSQSEYERVIENLKATLDAITDIKDSLKKGKKALVERMKSDPNFYADIQKKFKPLVDEQNNLKILKAKIEKIKRDIADGKEVKTNSEQLEMEQANFKAAQKRLKKGFNSIKKYYNTDPKAQLDLFTPYMLAVFDGLRNSMNAGKDLPNLAESDHASQSDYDKIANLLDDEISELTQHEQACLLEYKDAKERQETFAKFQISNKTRLERADSYATLIQIRDELDRAIVQKTNFVAKMYGKASRKNSTAWNIAYRLVQGLAAVVMVATVIPVAGVIVGKCIARSNDPKTKRWGERIFEFFNLTDASAKTRLDTTAKVVADFIQAASLDYNRATSEESTVIYQLFQQYLNHTGLELRDLIPKTKKESDKTYEARLQGLAAKLSKLSGKTPTTLPAQENSESFLETVQEFVGSEKSFTPKRFKEKVQSQSRRASAEERMNELEKENLKTKMKLTPEKLKWYVQLAIEEQKPFEKRMQFDYYETFVPIINQEIKTMTERDPNNPKIKHAQKLLQALQDESRLHQINELLPKKGTKQSPTLLIQKRKGLRKFSPNLKQETSPPKKTPDV